MYWMNKSQLAGPGYSFSTLLLKTTAIVDLSGSRAHCGKGVEERRNCSRCRRRAKTIDSFLCSISTTGLTKSDKDEGNIALSVYIGIG